MRGPPPANEMQLHSPRPTAIMLNGEPVATEARTLAELVAGQGFAATKTPFGG